jgi:putative ABC transport system substrate-binding protein
MRRREFIAGLGGAAAWPLTARAQPSEPMRRVGVLVPYYKNDPVAKARISALTQALADLGWTDGRNVRMDLRWTGGDTNRMRALADELVGLQPDIIVASTTPVTAALQPETRTIPIDFVSVGDPVGSGLVAALNQPGGNITGFATLEASAIGPTQVRKRLSERREIRLRPRIVFVAPSYEHADAPHPVGLLRPCRERPDCRCTNPRNELPPPHSITSSASANKVGGMVRPSALAVVRFTAI